MKGYAAMKYRNRKRTKVLNEIGETLSVIGALLFCIAGVMADGLQLFPILTLLIISIVCTGSGCWMCGRFGGLS